ncbi:PB1 domain-containing protein [Abeliophyllum distichum]|uniref:PB1 domain-containing protein n=1 Tax=Abeliophyllum distichum TaxID=126358 RepID=A0ABD1TEF1_9LAMI
MSRDGEKHQQPPPPLSSSAATAARFSPVILMASSITTVVKLVFFPSSNPSPLLLPTEDLDALVSITSNEDLANLIEEYDRVAPLPAPPSLKIRAFPSVPKTSKKVSPPPLYYIAQIVLFLRHHATPRCPKPIGCGPFFRHVLRPPVYPQPAGEIPQNAYINHGHINFFNFPIMIPNNFLILKVFPLGICL